MRILLIVSWRFCFLHVGLSIAVYLHSISYKAMVMISVQRSSFEGLPGKSVYLGEPQEFVRHSVSVAGSY